MQNDKIPKQTTFCVPLDNARTSANIMLSGDPGTSGFIHLCLSQLMCVSSSLVLGISAPMILKRLSSNTFARHPHVHLTYCTVLFPHYAVQAHQQSHRSMATCQSHATCRSIWFLCDLPAHSIQSYSPLTQNCSPAVAQYPAQRKQHPLALSCAPSL